MDWIGLEMFVSLPIKHPGKDDENLALNYSNISFSSNIEKEISRSFWVFVSSITMRSSVCYCYIYVVGV